MSRVEDSGVGINEIICLNEGIPRHNLLKIASARQHPKNHLVILHDLGAVGRLAKDNSSDDNPSHLQFAAPAHNNVQQK